jgi:hypothetical protein
MSKVNHSEHSDSQTPTESAPEIELDPIFKNQIDNFYRLTVYSRWIVISLLWMTVGIYSLWELRYPISLIREDFTWAAVKYGLIFNPIPALGLCLCVGLTTGTLVWQSRNLIWGLPLAEKQYSIDRVAQIRKQGRSHPLWKWVVKSVES